jgi:hypothetical protein
VISIVILRAHGAKGHGAHFIALMSFVRRSLSAILYVDDTDLLHINMDADELIADVHTAIQQAIDTEMRYTSSLPGVGFLPSRFQYQHISHWKGIHKWEPSTPSIICRRRASSLCQGFPSSSTIPGIGNLVSPW